MKRPGSAIDRLVPRAIMALAALSLAGASVVVKSRFDADLRRTQASIVDRGRRISENAGHELELREMSVQGMRLLGESLLSRRVALGGEAVDALASVPGRSAYYLRAPAGSDLETIGNLTGYGPIPHKGGPAAREAEMAIELTPLFRTLVSHNPDTPWVYYTSLSGFMYLYPRIEAEEFTMSASILGMDFVRKALPESNPSRAVVWTPVYEDAAGKGRMVTVSAPVYEGGHMRGVISADISVDELDWLLGFIDVPHSTLRIVDGDGEVVISAGGGTPPEAATIAAQATLVRMGDRWLTVFPLKAAGWSLVIDTDAEAIVNATLVGILPLASLIVAFAGILLLLVALVRNLRRVETLSTKDPLTGLLNRRMFEERAAERQARAKRGLGGYGLAIFDIDDFKKYNDAFGHHEGDRALREVARASTESLVRATDLVFRIGGEEFAALVDAESEERMEAAMAKLVDAVASLGIAHPNGKHGTLTVSMGGVLVRADAALSAEEAYRMSDGALYAAKAAGKNRAILDRGTPTDR